MYTQSVRYKPFIYHGSHIGASNSQENGGPWVHEAGRDFLSCREGGKPFLTSNLWYVASPILTSNLVGLKYIQFGFEWFHPVWFCMVSDGGWFWWYHNFGETPRWSYPIWFWDFAATPNFWETLEWISLPQCKTITAYCFVKEDISQTCMHHGQVRGWLRKKWLQNHATTARKCGYCYFVHLCSAFVDKRFRVLIKNNFNVTKSKFKFGFTFSHYLHMAVCQNLVPLFCSHQNSWVKMDVHPTKNGIYRYWPIPKLIFPRKACSLGRPGEADFLEVLEPRQRRARTSSDQWGVSPCNFQYQLVN